jgi:hypothetical protein
VGVEGAPVDAPERQFDDANLVANAGLVLPATLAQHLGLEELYRRHVRLGDAPGQPNACMKAMTLIHSALAGGDCIDDADVLRSGCTEVVLGHRLRAPSTLGTFLRSFCWGDVRSLDRVARVALGRAWKAGAGPRGRRDRDRSHARDLGPGRPSARVVAHTPRTPRRRLHRPAAMLGVSRGRVYQLIEAGKLDRHPDGGVLRSDILQRVAARPQ